MFIEHFKSISVIRTDTEIDRLQFPISRMMMIISDKNLPGKNAEGSCAPE